MIHQNQGLVRCDVTLATNVRLSYAEAGDPDARPLVLLHGLSDSWFSFSRVLPALAEHYRVFALDQRGHGDSDRPATGYAMTDFAADVAAFLDALGLPQAAVVGHSMGSEVAISLALAAPQRVAGLVLVGASTNWNTPEVVEFQRLVDTLEDPIGEAFVREFQASTAFEPLPAAFMDRVVAESMKLPAHVWRAALRGQTSAEYAHRLGEIRTPVLVIGGEHDVYCAPDKQRELAAKLAHAELKQYPRVAHCPHWERPEAFVRDVVAFLGRVVGP